MLCACHSQGKLHFRFHFADHQYTYSHKKYSGSVYPGKVWQSCLVCFFHIIGLAMFLNALALYAILLTHNYRFFHIFCNCLSSVVVIPLTNTIPFPRPLNFLDSSQCCNDSSHVFWWLDLTRVSWSASPKWLESGYDDCHDRKNNFR